MFWILLAKGIVGGSCVCSLEDVAVVVGVGIACMIFVTAGVFGVSV